MDTERSKTCSTCQKVKSREEFNRKVSRRDSLTSQCKGCIAASAARYRAANTEKVKACTTRWRVSNVATVKARISRWREVNSEKLKAYNANYRVANPEKAKAQRARFRASNPDKVKASHLRYRTANPEKLKVSRARYHAANLEKFSAQRATRRALQLAAIPTNQSSWERAEIARTYELRPLISALCGIEMHVDHAIPLTRGGEHSLANLEYLPASINLAKNNKLNSECTGEVGEFLNGPPTYHQVAYIVRRDTPRAHPAPPSTIRRINHVPAQSS